jgi:hypothetical protein
MPGDCGNPGLCAKTTRADVGGVGIVFECDSVEIVKQYIADFPLSKAGLIEWDYIGLCSRYSSENEMTAKPFSSQSASQ